MALDHFETTLEIKSVQPEQRLIIGYAAVASNIDRVSDILDPSALQKVVARQKPTDVSVFVGHDTAQIPVGVCVEWTFDGKGLLTTTKIFDGPAGDSVLGAARGLQAVGRTLGQSIGYLTKDRRFERTADGKTIRRLLDIDIREYSLADSTQIANTEALVVAVKQMDPDAADDASEGVYTVQAQDAGWAVCRGDGSAVAVYPTADLAEAVRTALVTEAARDAVEDAAEMLTDMAGGKTAPRGGTMTELPDSAYLLIAPGGVMDEAGLTTPRSLRHFPTQDSEGKLCPDVLRATLAALPAAAVDGLSVQVKTDLTARARRLLEQAEAGATVDQDGPEWKTGAALQVRGVGYALLDTSDAIADELAAMARLGQDTKAGARMQAPMRAKLRDCVKAINDILDWAEMADAGTLESGKLALYQRRLDLAALSA